MYTGVWSELAKQRILEMRSVALYNVQKRSTLCLQNESLRLCVSCICVIIPCALEFVVFHQGDWLEVQEAWMHQTGHILFFQEQWLMYIWEFTVVLFILVLLSSQWQNFDVYVSVPYFSVVVIILAMTIFPFLYQLTLLIPSLFSWSICYINGKSTWKQRFDYNRCLDNLTHPQYIICGGGGREKEKRERDRELFFSVFYTHRLVFAVTKESCDFCFSCPPPPPPHPPTHPSLPPKKGEREGGGIEEKEGGGKGRSGVPYPI